MLGRVFLLLLLASCSLPVLAQSERDMRAQAQASMVVSGMVDIEPDGSVSAYELDHRDELPPYVADVIDKAVPDWRFAPVMVDGVTVPARARMGVRLVAARAGIDGVEVTIRSASFGAYDEGDTGSVGVVSRKPPSYPTTAALLYASSDVYVVLKIGRAGEVLDVAVEQVNLRSAANGTKSERLRTLFSKAAVEAARKWVFRPPTTGDQADAPYWSATTMISFVMQGEPVHDYGRWIAYIPGPRQMAPWLREADHNANDALAAGTIQQLGTGPRLLTRLQPET